MGLRILEQVEDVGIVAIPDAVFRTPPVLSVAAAPPDNCLAPPAKRPDPVASDPTAVASPLRPQDSVQLQLQMIDQCQRLQYRVALIDPPTDCRSRQVQQWPSSQGLVSTPSSRFAASTIRGCWLRIRWRLKD